MTSEVTYYQISTTAPTNERLSKEMAVYSILESLNIPYERIDHPEAMTIEACQDIDKIFNLEMNKNLFLCNRQKTDFYLLLMPGNKPFKTKDLSQQIGAARLSFAEASFMEEFLNITPGSVSVMGLMNDKEKKVNLLIDKDLLSLDEIGIHPCVNTSTLKISVKNLTDVIIPALGREVTVVDLPDPSKEQQ